MEDEPEDGALATRAEASQHFRVDTLAMSYGELWAAGKVWFPLNVALKLLRVRAPVSLIAPLSTSLQALQWDALPERARTRLRAVVNDLEPRGFNEVLLFAEDWRAFKLDCMSVALLDEAGTTMVLAMYSCLHTVGGTRMGEHVDIAFYSFTDDGRIVMTRSSPYLMRQPPEYDVVHLQERPAQQVAAVHAERLASAAADGQPYRDAAPWRVVHASTLPAKVLSLSRRETQFQVERGVYVPATSQDLATLETPIPPATRAKPARTLAVWAALIVLFLLIANLL